MRRFASSVLVLVSCFGASSALAQEGTASSGLDLAIGLGREFGFSELAQELLEELRGQGVSGDRLEYAIATVLESAIARSGPGRFSDRASERAVAYRERLAAYDAAIRAFDRYLSVRDPGYRRSAALESMLRLVREKLDLALRWLHVDGRQPEEVRAELIGEAIESGVPGEKLWESLVRHVRDEMARLESELDRLVQIDVMGGTFDYSYTGDLEAALVRLLFETAEIHLAQYELRKAGDEGHEDAGGHLSVAGRSFREVADLFGDASNLGMIATSREGECYFHQGRVADALRYFSRVFDVAVPIPDLRGGEDPLSIDALVREWELMRDEHSQSPVDHRSSSRVRRRLMCEAYERAMRLFRDRGYLPEALAIAERFLAERTRWRRATESGIPALRELGDFEEAHRATLEAGIVFARSGRTGDAIRLLWEIAGPGFDDRVVRPRGLLERRAVDEIREIASRAEEGFLGAESYRAAAISAYLDREYVVALDLLRKSIRAFDTRGGQGEVIEGETFLVTCYDLMARCQTFRSDGGEPRRHLAAAAARHGSLHFYEVDGRHVGFDSPRCLIALRFEKFVRRLQAEDPSSDHLLEDWLEEARILKVARCW